jgi:integrase
MRQPGTTRPGRRALAAWKAENERRIKTAEDSESVPLLVPLTPHEARHTAASLMIAAGVNAKALSTIMGHATIAMTSQPFRRTHSGWRARVRRGSCRPLG